MSGVKQQHKQTRMEILLMILFAASIAFAFYLINFDEMIKAFIGIIIINGWFFTILYFHITGRIKFADDLEDDLVDDLENEQEPENKGDNHADEQIPSDRTKI